MVVVAGVRNVTLESRNAPQSTKLLSATPMARDRHHAKPDNPSRLRQNQRCAAVKMQKQKRQTDHQNSHQSRAEPSVIIAS